MEGAVSLCTVDDVRTKLNMLPDDDSRDDEIAEGVDGIAELFREKVGREFVAVDDDTRQFELNHRVRKPTIIFDRDDLATVTEMKLHPGTADEVVLTADDWSGRPTRKRHGVWTRVGFNPVALTSTARSNTFGFIIVEITGSWGFPTVPGPVKDAAVKTIVAWLRRDVQAIAPAGFNDEPRGSTPQPFANFAIPGDCWSILAPYMKGSVY